MALENNELAKLYKFEALFSVAEESEKKISLLIPHILIYLIIVIRLKIELRGKIND